MYLPTNLFIISQLGTIEKDLKMREKMSFRMKSVDVLKLFIQICEGIKVFHNYRPTPLAHRDIKPSNILLAADGTPVIMDLGNFSFLFSSLFILHLIKPSSL